ncbi:MAG TPA: asparaginase [Actinomycetales bacterium]|nr:asparaginase [Actinomycetales bacterium]
MPQPTPSQATGPVPVAHVVRSGFVESVHHGSAVVRAPDGSVALSAGDTSSPIFPRSSNKPLQALAMVRSGLGLDGELLALACSSHSGEEFHRDGVRRILSGAGLGLDALQNTPALPFDEVEKRAWLAAGNGPSSLVQNCSGKHAAMLATCVAAGWDTTTYRDPQHPLQRAIAEALEELSGESVAAVGVDGCGAPVMAISLSGLARAFAALATGAPGTPEQRVAAAMRAYPEWVGGTRRAVTALMRGVPGLIAKDGAEAVYAAALPSGLAVAVKVADGNDRAAPVLLAQALRDAGVDADVLDEVGRPPVLGHGEPVGAVEPLPLR